MGGASVEDGVVDPVQVWAVRLGNPESESKGRLALEDDALVFRLSEGELRLPLADIRKARRIRGSPVLTVDVEENARPVRFAFYFVEPPPLQPKGRESKGRARRRGTGYLAMAAPRYKGLIQEWERAIREAVARQG